MALTVTTVNQSDDKNPKNEDQAKGVSVEAFEKLQRELEELKNKPQAGQSVDMTAISELAKALKGSSGSDEFNSGYANETELDPNDVLDPENWEIFFSHVVFYTIVDDMRNGRPVRTPFGSAINFEYDSSKRSIGQTGEENIFNLCKYVCKSKKEARWLREHRSFGIYFFDNIKKAKDMSGKEAAVIARIMSGLNSVGQHDLMAMARGAGIAVTTESDLGTIRSQLAMLMAKDEISKEVGRTRSIVEENILEEEILKSK